VSVVRVGIGLLALGVVVAAVAIGAAAGWVAGVGFIGGAAVVIGIFTIAIGAVADV
jgi:hypothetical protein